MPACADADPDSSHGEVDAARRGTQVEWGRPTCPNQSPSRTSTPDTYTQ